MVLALCLIEAKISCYFPDLTHTKDGLRLLLFGRLDGGMCSTLPQALAVCWYREHNVMLKEAELAIQQDPPGSRCHLSQGEKLTPRKGRGKGGLCNFRLYCDLQEKPRFYCCWHFMVQKIKSQFSVENLKRMVSVSECGFKATLKSDWIVEENNFL